MKNNNIYVNGVEIVMNGDYENNKAYYCIGLKDCNDTSCKLVKEYREKQKAEKKEIKT